MKVPIPNRIIRLIFRELMYLKFEERSEFQPIGVAYRNATRGCPFGREMVDQALNEIINREILESNGEDDDLLKLQYKFTPKGKELISKGNYEEVFEHSITTRKFFFTHNGEYGFSDIYEKRLLKWKLLNYEIDIDPITEYYFEIAKYLNYQIWLEENVINMAANYLGHIKMIQIPLGIINKLKLEIYEKGEEQSKLRLQIADSNLRGVLMEGNINENNYENFKQRVWEMEHSIIPQLLDIFNAKLTSTKRLTNA